MGNYISLILIKNTEWKQSSIYRTQLNAIE